MIKKVQGNLTAKFDKFCFFQSKKQHLRPLKVSQVFRKSLAYINSMLLRNDIVYLSALTKLFCFVKAIIWNEIWVEIREISRFPSFTKHRKFREIQNIPNQFSLIFSPIWLLSLSILLFYGLDYLILAFDLSLSYLFYL